MEIGNTPTIVKTGIHVDGGVRGSNPLKSIIKNIIKENKIMKYKVGDKVKIREDLEDGQLYGNEVFVGNMMACRGRIAIIDDIICDNRYYIDIDQEYCVWTDEMFEDYTETTAMTVKDLLNKTDVEKGGLIITVYYPNAYFEATIGHNKINRNSELYKRFIKAYGDMIVDEISFDIRSENMVVMLIKVDYTD